MMDISLLLKENLLVLAYAGIVFAVGYFLVEFYPSRAKALKK